MIKITIHKFSGEVSPHSVLYIKPWLLTPPGSLRSYAFKSWSAAVKEVKFIAWASETPENKARYLRAHDYIRFEDLIEARMNTGARG